MQRVAIAGAKGMLAILFAISVFTQMFVIPQLAAQTVAIFPEAEPLRVPGIIGCVAIVICMQVVLVCIWELLSMVARSRIFQPAAFGPVNVVIASGVAAIGLFLIGFVILTAADAMSPGALIVVVAGIVGGAGLTLLVVVMRELLRKASALEHDLSEVI